MEPALTSSRRELLSGAGAAISLLLIGCAPSNQPEAADAKGSNATEARPQRLSMVVHRDPGCGCCETWAELARRAGYEVALRDEPDMPAVKQRLGVPASLASCHSATIANYVVEGHVPFDRLARLLSERPAGVRGIAVAGMPAGSPGMESPDGRSEPFQVFAFDARGRSFPFA